MRATTTAREVLATGRTTSKVPSGSWAPMNMGSTVTMTGSAASDQPLRLGDHLESRPAELRLGNPEHDRVGARARYLDRAVDGEDEALVRADRMARWTPGLEVDADSGRLERRPVRVLHEK